MWERFGKRNWDHMPLYNGKFYVRHHCLNFGVLARLRAKGMM